MTRPLSEERLLHLAVGETGAACVREGLRLVGRDDEIEFFSDDLSVGPIHDVDRGAATRAAWWRRVHANRFRPSPKEIDDAAIWKRIVADDRRIVLWYSPHPAEYVHALRACWFLRRSPSRVWEIRLTSPFDPPPAGYAIGMAGPRGVAAAWPKLRRVRHVGRRAERWAELRERCGDGFRELRRDRIVELPATAHDDALIDACAGRWTSSTRVVAHVFSEVPVGDFVLSWRVRELLRSGALEGRGARTGLDLPNEIRPAVSNVQRRAATP